MGTDRTGDLPSVVIRLKKSTVFALYALHDLATAPDTTLTATEIAQRYGVSEHHLAKVLQRLARAGIVHGVRGARGGFRLGADPRAVTLLQVVELFQAREEPRQPTSEAPAGAAGALRLAQVLDELDEQVYYTLKSISLATLVAPRRLA